MNKHLLHLGLVMLLFLAGINVGWTQTSMFDFNTTGQLTNSFNGAGTHVSNVTQSTDGGLNNSGAVSVPSSSTNAVFTTKNSYSLGAVGSSYTFETFIKSEGNSGYSGVGFTADSPTTSFATSPVYRPSDALGVSVHGGGFVFHNGTTNYSGSWGTTYTSGSITTVKASTCNDLINNNTSCGSPDKWFKVVFKVTRSSSTNFDMRVEVWPADQDGTLRFPTEATAIFEVNGVSNTDLASSTQLFSYFNFSGHRVTKFDNFSYNLKGASEIQAGAPVILTESVTESNRIITVNGNVTSDNGDPVTDRGFVYGTSPNPTITGSKISVGSGTGTFSGSTGTLSAGTYYVRAFATNAVATSYGEEFSVTITVVANSPTITSTPNTTIPYGQQYLYSVVSTIENDLETTLSAPTLPSWLTFSTDGQNSATLYGNVPAGVLLSGVAGDEDGNIYAIRQNGTEIFKIEPDGTTTSWKSGMISGSVYALHIANGYIYIPRYNNATQSITRIPLNNPAAVEETFLTRSGGTLSLTDKDGFIYAANQIVGEILKINESTKAVEVLLNSTNGIPSNAPFGLTFDGQGNLYIATWTNRTILKYDGTNLSTVLSDLPNHVASIRLDNKNNFYLSMSSGGVRKYTSDFSSFQVVSLSATDNIWSLSITSSGALVYSKLNTNEVFHLQTGAIVSGTPTKSQLGDHPVVLRASNANGFTEQSFTITVTDETAPVVTTFVPANNATNVAQQPSLSITFDEEVVLGASGTFTVNNGSTVLRTYDLSVTEDRNAFTLSEDQLTLTVGLDITLPVNTAITVGISAGFVKDAAENNFAGFAASSNTWRFTTINKEPQTINFPEIAAKTYGDPTFTLGDATTDKGLTVTYTATDPTIVSISGNQATILKAGSTTITASQAGDDTHFAAENVQRTLTVEKRALTITSDDKSKTYGEANPTLTFTYTGLTNGDTKVATEPSISTTATQSSNVGTYPITLEGGSDDNYTITLVAGTLTIGKKAVTITADDKLKTYGEENPALTFSYSGLTNGDTKVATEPSISTTATQSSNAGTYPITLTGGSDDNYTITLVNGTMTVGKKAVTITADDKSKTYGEENPALTFSYSGLTNGDTKVTTEPNISTTATQSSNAGNYPITLEGGSDDNYTITLVAGTLTIGKKAVTITADDKSKTYGEENPALTFSYSGLTNGDTQVATEPSISTTATQSSNAGTYPITLAGGSDDNYTITLVAGTLTIGKKAVTITADDKSKTYGEANPTLTFTYTGLANGDTKVATEPSISTTASQSSNVGTYPITLTGGSDDNYTITLVNGTMTVGKKAVTITADDKSKTYGEENPVLTFSYEGLTNGDTKVATEPSISTTATQSSNSGTYPITLAGGSDDNYTITLVNGTMTVGKKAVTITADNKSKTYGEENPALTFSYSGLTNGDTKVTTEPNISTTATQSSNAGTYPITLEGGSDDNYTITLVAGTLTIGKKAVTITADDKSKTYGEENPALTFSYSGLTNGDTQVATEPSISTTATQSSNVGTYPITLEGGSDDNYTITLVAGTLTIGKKAVTITADDKSKTYGEANPTLTFTYTGLANGDTKVATEPSISTTASQSSNVGTYPITLTGGSDDNYTITLVNGTMTVGKKAVTITADDKSKTYGEENPVLTFSYEGLTNGDTKVATEPSISTTATQSSNAGTYPITLAGGSDDNYTITLVNGTMTVGKKAVTITADNKSKTYGEENPALTFSYSGLTNGDTKVATEPSISTTATQSSNAGTYPITLTGGSDDNYTITLVNGTLTIGKKAVTITADDKSKTYGEENPVLTFSYEGLTNGDTKVATEPSISTTATQSSNVGTYPITLEGGSDDNYTITLVAGTLTIGKKAVTITADDKSKTYGEENPALTFSYSGLTNGDTKVATEPSISTTATQSSNSGTYPITLTGGSDDNYTITLVNGTMTVGKKAVTITADDKSKTYGEENPVLTFSYEGLTNGDTKVATEPSISTTATQSSNVGTYPITLAGGSDDNYTITLVNGTMTVGKKAVTITADNKSKTYGEENPALTFSYSGLTNGDTKVATEPSISTTATQSSNAGTYPITLTGGSDDNYEITLVNGTLTIGKKAVTITADDKSKTYGEANPTLTFTYTGLVNGDTKVATEPSISTTATQSSNAGTYPITLTGGSDDNYTITLVNGTMTVGKKAVTITADDKSKTYGEENPALTFSYSGLTNGDTKVATEPSISTTATQSSNSGTYPITLTGGSDDNYTITLVAGTLTIGKKAVTITADDKSKTYGEENPVLTFSYEGLTNGDTKVATEPSISTTATQSSNVGTYPITLAGGSDDNYTITLVNGTMTVGKAAMTITADNQVKIYGEDNPPLTITYTGLVNGDTKASIEPGISTSATKESAVGTYPIQLSGGSDSNYDITLVNGNLEVVQARLTVRAENKSKVYGDPNPELTYVYEGLVNGDAASSISPSISTEASHNSAVGTYSIKVSGASDGNYDIVFENGILEITPATLTVAVMPGQYKIYGTDDPEFEYQITGFKFNDGNDLISGSLARENGETVGKYEINLGTLKANDNYKVEYQGSEFEIIHAKVEAVINPADVETAWNTAPELPQTITVMTEDGRFMEFEVIWDMESLNILARGEYEIKGTVMLPDGVLNLDNYKGSMVVRVLAKPAPADLLLSNNTFEGSATEFFIHVGGFSVMDAYDHTHEVYLKGNEGDNKYFEIKDKMLFWSSAEQVEGRDTFFVTVSVTDRDGNTMDKVFEIKRVRQSVSDIEVFNSFTPNGDGVNDDWGIPDLRFYQGVTIRVFERSGLQVFVTNDPDQRWDGTINGKELPVGTYYWVLEVQETGETRRGMLNIIRK